MIKAQKQIVIFIILFMPITGCLSVQWKDSDGELQSVGFFRYSVIDTETARIFVRETGGLDLRLISFDPGISLGYRKYIAVQPRPPEVPIEPASGYFWSRDQVSSQAGLFFKKSWGADLGFSLLSNGVSLGYDKTTVVLGPKADEPVISKIDFYEDNLIATRFVQRRETR